MRTRQPVLVALALALAACTPDTAPTTTTAAHSPPETTTTSTVPTTTTTSTTIDPAVVANRTCDALKVASFDLGARVQASFASLDVGGDPSAVDDGKIGRIVVQSLVDFYDAVSTIADDAPADAASDLAAVAASVQPWRNALAVSDDLGGVLQTLDPASLKTSEVESALADLAAWTDDHCGTPIPLDSEEILYSTIFPAMFSAVGDVLDGGGTDGVDPSEPPPTDLFAVAHGDDPALDDLYDRCGAGDGGACSDLAFTAFGEYQIWGLTCGGTVMLLPTDSVDCGAKATGDSMTYGDDFVLDALQDACVTGDAASCDGLYGAAPDGSDYETVGLTCGGLRDADTADRPCAFSDSGDPYAFGDDPDLDGLWTACVGGDGQGCSDLFFASPFDSVYEAMGRTCGDLVDAGKPCDDVSTLLGGP